MLVHEQLRRFEGSIIKATKGGLTEAMGERLPRWTFTEALLYSITLITTIGNCKLKMKKKQIEENTRSTNQKHATRNRLIQNPCHDAMADK